MRQAAVNPLKGRVSPYRWLVCIPIHPRRRFDFLQCRRFVGQALLPSMEGLLSRSDYACITHLFEGDTSRSSRGFSIFNNRLKKRTSGLIFLMESERKRTGSWLAFLAGTVHETLNRPECREHRMVHTGIFDFLSRFTFGPRLILLSGFPFHRSSYRSLLGGTGRLSARFRWFRN